MKTAESFGYRARNYISNCPGGRSRSKTTRITKGAGAVVVVTGLLLISLEAFHPFLSLVWSSSAITVLWRFMREEARYMDGLARGFQENHESPERSKSDVQSLEMHGDFYDMPTWEGWNEAYLIVWA